MAESAPSLAVTLPRAVRSFRQAGPTPSWGRARWPCGSALQQLFETMSTITRQKSEDRFRGAVLSCGILSVDQAGRIPAGKVFGARAQPSPRRAGTARDGDSTRASTCLVNSAMARSPSDSPRELVPALVRLTRPAGRGATVRPSAQRSQRAAARAPGWRHGRRERQVVRLAQHPTTRPSPGAADL